MRAGTVRRVQRHQRDLLGLPVIARAVEVVVVRRPFGALDIAVGRVVDRSGQAWGWAVAAVIALVVALFAASLFVKPLVPVFAGVSGMKTASTALPAPIEQSGGASGIGRACAIHLAARGFHVLGTTRGRPASHESLAGERSLELDVTDATVSGRSSRARCTWV